MTRPCNNQQKKRTCQIVDFSVPGPCLVIEKTVEQESDSYINCNWSSWYSHQRIGTRTGGLGNNRTS